MTSAEKLGHLWVVGPGRVGRALGRMLEVRGVVEGVHYVGREALKSAGGIDPHPDLVLLTVRDDQIAHAAATIAGLGLSPAVILHTSGAFASDILEPLASHGWATGSIPPIVSISDPELDAEKLIGAWYAVEGAAAAVKAAEMLIRALDGHILRLDQEGKPLYHAAAVFASNYLVTLLAVAEGLMERAGADPVDAREALHRLAAGALANVLERGPEPALTGPIARGDVATVERHLVRLSPEERRLYSVLAKETLEIARRRGLEGPTADRLTRILAGTES